MQKKIADRSLPCLVFETSIPMLNENSGFDMQYQINKVHNLKLAARTIDRVVIEPGETFSFWQLVRWADREEKIQGRVKSCGWENCCILWRGSVHVERYAFLDVPAHAFDDC